MPEMKPGTLCWIIAPHKYKDKIVTLKKYYPNHPCRGEDGIVRKANWWQLTEAISTKDGKQFDCLPEQFLKPIDNPGDDVVDTFYLNIPKPERNALHA